jgi:Entner-Doudoroff aldolase
MNPTINQLENIGIIPVIRIDDADDAVPLGKALAAGGIPCAEVTYRTAQGEEAIRRMTESCPELLLGAGTVLTTAQVDSAIAAGAKFIVSPGLNPGVVGYCIERGIPIVPGCATPSDIECAMGLGLDVVKFFPAEANGGLGYIKAISAPYGNMRFIPTGGISKKNVAEYLMFNKVLACGGSWMVSPALIAEKRFDEITELCRQAVKVMHGFTVIHIGINSQDAGQAASTAQWFASMFGFDVKDGNSSVFASGKIEVLKSPGRGTNGHIAVGTNNVGRAMHYLLGMGVQMRGEDAIRGKNGEIVAVYLEREIAGFAVHLVKK